MGDTPRRKVRSDALRNRERLLEAARDVLGKGGPGASLEEVARRADVGIGTLYRHFPDREALFDAVYSRSFEELADLTEGLEARDDPVAALREWLAAIVSMVETKRGMLGALSIVMTEENKRTYDDAFKRVSEATEQLIRRGIEAGRIRHDITADDVIQTIFALCYSRPPGPEWREHVLRLLNIFVDGLAR
ncbi:TetR/AcrR family transcriptional regulator [Pelagovum pacificum]|uniref:TetR/AcrR family transcriptional regulator n=1 Tax=Pelagovum pacificum TaxID=2588711 RepID=A0A5C5GJ43_9RHOB|nr:TetR/AcrR family transcriptional regulator [Pelagovum pacificum]QQA42702.1 TetR/AcrR family transcriptional regulator [Pelagovum pacificum]TNY34147.1 TetR/AcrR family transcriptional regulator [Pelagovum pacificum]